MEPFFIEYAQHHRKLVAGFQPKPKPQAKSQPAGEKVTSRDMVVTTRLRPLLSDEETAGFTPAVFVRPREPGVVDMHEMRKAIRGPPLLNVRTTHQRCHGRELG